MLAEDVVGEEPAADPKEFDLSLLQDGAAATGTKLVFHRQDPSRPLKYYYLESVVSSDFSLEKFKRTYGGGEYRVRVYVPGGRGGVSRSHEFSIDPHFKPEPPTPAPVVGVVAEESRSGGDGLAELRVEIRELRALVEQRRTPVVDPVVTAIGLFEKMTTAFVATQAPVVAAQLPGEQATAMLMKGFDLASQLGGRGGGGGGSSFGELIEAFKPVLAAFVAQAAKPPKGPPPPAQVQVRERKPMMLEQLLHGYIPEVVRAAQSGQDPEAFAEAVLAEIPPSIYQTLHARLLDRGFLPWVMASYSEFRGHEAWVESFAGALRELLEDDGGGEAGREAVMAGAGGGG